MANIINYRVGGLNQLNARLLQLATTDATKAGQAANRVGAKKVLDAVKATAPIGPDAEGSIRNRRTKGGKTRQEAHHKIVNALKVRKVRADRDGVVINAVTAGDAYHASMVEYGSIHNAPNPFMRRGLDSSSTSAIDAIAVALNKQLIKRGV